MALAVAAIARLVIVTGATAYHRGPRKRAAPIDNIGCATTAAPAGCRLVLLDELKILNTAT
jgi:hypothetical protein